MPDMACSTDEVSLLKQISEGDEKAFQQLFAAYHQLLGAYVYKITRSREMAEEVIQDVFLKIWINRGSLNEVKSIKAYLFVLLKNHMLNCLRKIVKENVLKQQWEKDAIQHNNDYKDISSYYMLLDEAINQLPPQQQKVYLLSRHERLKYNEIAQKLNLSSETVKKYLKLATLAITSHIRANQEVVLFLLFIAFF